MNGFILGVWNIALVFEASDNPRRGRGLFGWRAMVFGGLAHNRDYIPTTKARHCPAKSRFHSDSPRKV
jgi:hypothetical protein